MDGTRDSQSVSGRRGVDTDALVAAVHDEHVVDVVDDVNLSTRDGSLKDIGHERTWTFLLYLPFASVLGVFDGGNVVTRSSRGGDVEAKRVGTTSSQGYLVAVGSGNHDEDEVGQ